MLASAPRIMPRRAQPPGTPRLAAALAAALSAVALAACSESPEPMVPPIPEPSPPLAAAHEVEDRVVAVLDEEAILLSDVDQVIGLGLVEERPGESLDDLRGRVLEGLIDQRLRFQQVDRFGLERVSVDVVETEVAKIAAQFPDRAAFLRRLAELDMTEEELDQLVARQLMVLSYVEERLGARIFVSLDDIRAYYDSEMLPGLRAAGEPVPPLEDVREAIRGLLRAERLNTEIVAWTERLRREADIQVFLFQPPEGPLPPLLRRTGPT
jgi:peptidyl-prolyl cis-trans isomerase SurA